MNALGAFLLLFMDEEDAFWMLATLVEDIMVDYYSTSMSGLQVDIKVTEHYIQKYYKDVWKHLEQIQANLSAVCMQWFLCIFVDIFPSEVTMRVWDVVMCTGRDILIKIVLQFIKTHKDQIMAIKNGGEFYELIKSYPQTIHDANPYIKEVQANFPLATKEVDDLRKHYKLSVEETIHRLENLKIRKHTKCMYNTPDSPSSSPHGPVRVGVVAASPIQEKRNSKQYLLNYLGIPV